MTSLEDSMKMQAIAILLATNDCPRVVKKRLYDELLNLAKIKLPEDELKEYEEAFKPKPNPWTASILQGYSSNNNDELSPPFIQAQPTTPSIMPAATSMNPDDCSTGELAFGITNNIYFRYATKRSPQEFEEIIKKAKNIVESQDKTGEPRGYSS